MIFGGSAGGGKSWSLQIEPLRHFRNKRFSAVIFRRTLADAKKPGATWDQMGAIYPLFEATPNQSTLEYRFKSGAKVAIGHLEHETTVHDWMSAEVPLLLFDELTHFTRNMFFYMLSRNRSTCGIRPYVRASCNPDADSWVAEFIAWWINQDTGYPIPERDGIVRWFIRVNDAFVWADTREELQALNPGSLPKSVTFIRATLDDNKILCEADPGYRANLMALSLVDRERLLKGNWKIRPAAGLFFQRRWCTVVEAVPVGTKWVRGWDLAATVKTETNDPDFTAGVKIGLQPNGRYLVGDHTDMRCSPLDVETALRNTATQDTKDCRIAIPQDPGASGKAQVPNLAKLLNGFDVRFRMAGADGDKVGRFKAFSAQAEAGNVDVLRGAWNETWFANLEAFPESKHDDSVDATSEAFNSLLMDPPMTYAMPIVTSGKPFNPFDY